MLDVDALPKDQLQGVLDQTISTTLNGVYGTKLPNDYVRAFRSDIEVMMIHARNEVKTGNLDTFVVAPDESHPDRLYAVNFKSKREHPEQDRVIMSHP